MSDKELDQLDEVKATLGSPNETHDSVTPAGGDPKKKNRPADVSKTVDPNADNIEDDVKTPQGTAAKKAKEPAAGVSMKESVEEMFAGQNLSEEFKEKATVVFEAAVNAKLNEEVQRLEEQFEAKLEEQTALAVDELVEKVDSYLDYVVEKWMEENELAVEKGIRAEIAESFIAGLADLFAEHNINLPEEEADVVADMAEQLEQTEEKLDEAIAQVVELRKELTEAKKADAFSEIAESLTETQAEKLEKLAEGVEFENLDEYKAKVKIIKENYFGGAKELTESVDEIDPIEEETSSVKAIDPDMARYTAAISKSLRK
jgi:hypothetical protein